MKTRRSTAPSARIRKDVEEFLASAPSGTRRGTCLTCRLSNRAEIEQAVTHYAKRRQDGATHVTFRSFVRMHMRPKLGYPGQSEALRRHMEQCCGRKIP